MSAEKRQDSVEDVGVFTSTTEALSLTILTELLRRTSLHPEVPSEVSVTFDAVYAAELDHWNFISQHFDPSTTNFWVPDGFFGGADDALDLTAVGKGVSAGETLFINTYLVAVTTFAEAGRSELARYSAEVAGYESEHRVLGQTLAGEARPTISDSRSSPLTTSVISRPPSWAPVSALGKKGRAPGASTISRTLRWLRRARSARTNRHSSNAVDWQWRTDLGGEGRLLP